MDVFYTILYYSFLMSLLWHTIAVLYFWCIWYTSYTMNFLRSFLFYYNFLFFTILWRILNYESDFYGILFYDLFMIYYSLEFLGTELLNFLLQWLLWNMTLLMVFFMTLYHILYIFIHSIQLITSDIFKLNVDTTVDVDLMMSYLRITCNTTFLFIYDFFCHIILISYIRVCIYIYIYI